MFSKILVANRGEIACRIIRTARRIGIATVAVYSEADRGAPHVEMADEAAGLGPSPPVQSYLAIEKIVAACRLTGAQAVHPGYGFLSENAAFARAVEEAGLVFIGPSADAIAAMGDKLESKRIAAAAGVPVVPGEAGAVATAAEATRAARTIGYPVMLKASAGGGGKGMRLVSKEQAMDAAFRLASSEARSAFGDDRILVEKAIPDPRHIEIQILADAHGNVVHLGERECSIQRRHQKVVEEAPSPLVDAAMRNAMGAQAVALARAVDYRNAGTVEFIVGADRNFYFLEMNTRLQVEHPVTELVTGIDLVEAMIRIAAGEPLRFHQADVRLSGWAIEARIYAEDPRRGFLPSAGRLTRYRPPIGSTDGATTIRLDDGVVEGSEIPLFYDPLIAKLCTHAPDRAASTAALSDALDAFVIDGVSHNIVFLSALMAHPRWREGRLSTAFIEEEYPGGFRHEAPAGQERISIAAIATAAEIAERSRLRFSKGHAPEAAAEPRDGWTLLLGRERIRIGAEKRTDTPVSLDVSVEGASAVRVESGWQPGERVWRGTIDDAPVVARLRREENGLRVERRGVSVSARLLTNFAAGLVDFMQQEADAAGSRQVRSPMPGIVVSIDVAEGQAVEAGETLAVVEAMKMENVLRAERGGRIARIVAKPGDSLAVDAVIMEFAGA